MTRMCDVSSSSCDSIACRTRLSKTPDSVVEEAEVDLRGARSSECWYVQHTMRRMTLQITRRDKAVKPSRSRRFFRKVKGTKRRRAHRLGVSRKNRRAKLRTKAALTAAGYFQQPEKHLCPSKMEVVMRDPERPRFHVMPMSGWLNDPNGPVYYKGRYHLFYQHVPNRVEWDWGLVWGHAYSEDLIRWEHLPIALKPTEGGHDADGCFSGTCIRNVNGAPMILYTGVRLRSKCADCLPPAELDLNLPFIETQLAAVADPITDDELMIHWKKLPEPILKLPPGGNLTGWRDPFIFREGDSENQWLMLVGSGIKGVGGTVLKYTCDSDFTNWTFAGYLCQGDADTGAMWECPLLRRLKPHKRRATTVHTDATADGNTKPVEISTKLQQLSLEAASSPNGHDEVDDMFSYFFCVSPDAPTNPVFYWLGHLDENDVFCIEKATKCKRLDLGDILYAPNLTEDENGDTLLWGWLQERRTVGSYDYSGCLSVPRRLSIKRDKLFQEPAERIKHLRSDTAWELKDVPLFPEESIPIEDVHGQALDIELVIERGSSDATGLLVRSWNVGGEGTAAVVFDWERSCLEVVFEALNPDTMEFFLDADNSRRIGGPLDWHPGEPLVLRIILDHSCLEVFTGSGEVLSTRVYRGEPFHGDDSGLDFISFGGTAVLKSAVVYEMQSIWRKESPLISSSASEAVQDAPFFGMPEMEQLQTSVAAPTHPMN